MPITLPSGYITLRSIRSTGSQYIALPYAADSGLAVTVEFDDNWGSGALFGARDGAYAITAMFESKATGTIRYGTRQQTFNNFPSSPPYGLASCRVYASNSQMTVNNLVGGGRVNYDISPGSFETGLRLYLCAENYNGTARYKCAAEIYSVSINGYSLVPCMKADTGQTGLYDTRKGVFLASASGEDFRAGIVFGTSLPNTYIKTDYIEATGTQYIDTGYIPNSATRVVLDFEPTSTAFGCLFGARTSVTSSGDSADTFGMWMQDTSAFPHYGNGAYNQKPITIPSQTRLTFNMDRATTTVNETSVTFDSTTFNSGCNLTLFGMNTAGSVDGRRAVGKLYSCKIYNDGTLIRDFVPCINPSGVAGLWDKVTGTFYASANGTFTTGSKHKTLIDGTGYEIKSGRVLIAGTGYDIKKGRTLIDGTGYDIKFGTPVGELAVGTSVYIDFNGTRREFIVVNQGNPDPDDYDDSCNGTWLYQKYVYEQQWWTARNSMSRSDYKNSGIHLWLNGDYLNMMDGSVRSLLKTVKVPYQFSSRYNETWYISNGADGLETKAFLPSLQELGIKKIQYASHPAIGTRLSYFTEYAEYPYDGDANFVAHTPDGVASMFFTRQITEEDSIHASYFSTAGQFRTMSVSAYIDIIAAGVLPIIILPQDAMADSDFNIIPS